MLQLCCEVLESVTGQTVCIIIKLLVGNCRICTDMSDIGALLFSRFLARPTPLLSTSRRALPRPRPTQQPCCCSLGAKHARQRGPAAKARGTGWWLKQQAGGAMHTSGTEPSQRYTASDSCKHGSALAKCQLLLVWCCMSRQKPGMTSLHDRK